MFNIVIVKLDMFYLLLHITMKFHDENQKEFLEFYETRRKEPQNVGKSFTYGCCFYDFMCKRTRPRTTRQQERELIQAYVCSFLDIPMSTGDLMKPRALLEILDISTLDEIARHLYDLDREPYDTDSRYVLHPNTSQDESD